MGWFEKVKDVLRRGKEYLPSRSPVEAVRESLSEALAERIRAEACVKAYEMLASAHRGVVFAILWQNAALILSLLPVYYLHSAIPFYVAYATVAGVSAYSVIQSRRLVARLVTTRSVTQTISQEVFEAVEIELTKRKSYERKIVEWLGADLRMISEEVARKLKPDLMAAAGNMVLTLLLAFVAFRLFAIPLLEQKALSH